MALISKLLVLLFCVGAMLAGKAQNRYDVVIAEIMADPTPMIGLPNTEWIELHNTTAAAINLNGWRIGDASGMSGALPSFVLLPDSNVVVCTASSVAALAVFGKAIAVTFPSLDNAGEEIYLRAPNGRPIHAVAYSSAWYQNAVKSDGGWSLEMVDPKNPCSGGDNWKASINPKGGTPGAVNSVNGANKDNTPPRLLRAFATDALNITVVFDEPLDSTQAALVAHYSITGIGVPVSGIALGPLFNRVSLKLATALQASVVHTVTATGVTDCMGNAIGAFNSCNVGLASAADSLDVVINEVLFHPKPSGVDYVEVYNRGKHIIDVQRLLLANRTSAGVIGSLKQLAAEPYLLYPGDYLVVTEDATIVKNQYLVKNPDAFAVLASMPSYPNDKGTVVLVDNAGNIIDQFAYTEKWHFALVDNNEGISLERIDADKPTQSVDNWTSAASSVGFGTPTYQNSQHRVDVQLKGTITITPPIFSPDNDGFEDFAILSFQFPEANYTANISIYDGAGRLIRVLQKNATCAAIGSFKWDGLNDKQAKVPIGIYVFYTEIFNLKGQRKTFKNSIVVARKF